MNVHPDLGSTYSDVLAPQDIALYGGLTALATFDRAELQLNVLTNLEFKEFLELVPEVCVGRTVGKLPNCGGGERKSGEVWGYGNAGEGADGAQVQEVLRGGA